MRADHKADCKRVDAEFDRRLGRTGQSISPEALVHLGECERCRSLYRFLAEIPSATEPSLELERRIAKNIRASLRPVSRLASPSVLTAELLLVFGIAGLAAGTLMKSPGAGLMSRGQLWGIGVILALGVVVLGRSLAWQITPGSRQRIPAWGAIAGSAVALLGAMVFLFPWKMPEAFLFRGWLCARLGIELAVPAAAVFWILVRRGAAYDLTTMGATLGAITGLLSVMLLQSRCGLHNVAHLVVWHFGVFAAATLFGALLGSLAERFRDRFTIAEQ